MLIQTTELNDKNLHLTDDSVHSKVLTINGPLKEGITVKVCIPLGLSNYDIQFHRLTVRKVVIYSLVNITHHCTK